MKSKNPKKKTGLGGKGLSILFQEGKKFDEKFSEEKKILKEKLQDIATDKIIPNALQPRTFFDEEKIMELSESIKNYGVIEPVIVSPANAQGEYELVAGERRWRACQKVGIKSIPAIINNQNSDNLIEMMLIENIQREDLNLIEQARSFKLILEKKNITQEELASSLGKNRTYITNLLRILKLPTFVLKDLEVQKVSLGQAKVLVGLKETEIAFLHEEIIKKNLTVREIEKKTKLLKSNKLFSKKEVEKKDPDLLEIEKLFREKLKTKVSIKKIKNKTGKIEVEYYDYDDLFTILHKIQ